MKPAGQTRLYDLKGLPLLARLQAAVRRIVKRPGYSRALLLRAGDLIFTGSLARDKGAAVKERKL